MAQWQELNEAVWEEWLAGRPEVIQELARRFRPDRLYRLTSSGHRCYPVSYSENGTLTVAVTGQFNRIPFGRKVFGIKPEDLIECDLPGPDEDLGETAREAGYSDDDITNILIPKLRRTWGSSTESPSPASPSLPSPSPPAP